MHHAFVFVLNIHNTFACTNYARPVHSLYMRSLVRNPGSVYSVFNTTGYVCNSTYIKPRAIHALRYALLVSVLASCIIRRAIFRERTYPMYSSNCDIHLTPAQSAIYLMPYRGPNTSAPCIMHYPCVRYLWNDYHLHALHLSLARRETAI